MKHLLISPTINLVELIGNILQEDKDKLSDNLIIFPGKRPGHFLKKYLADQLQSPFKAPRILSVDEFIDFIYESVGYSDRRITAIDAVPAIFELNKKEKLISTGEESFALDDFIPWGFKINSDFEEMHIESIEPSKVREVDVISGEKIPGRIRKKLVALSQLYKSFYEYLSKTNLSTRASRYRTVAGAIDKFDFSIFTRVILAGFFALTNSEKKIFAHAAKQNNVMFVFQKGSAIESTVRALNINVEEKEGETQKQKINFYKAMDVHGEVFRLSQIIKDKKTFDRKNVIVLPQSDTLFPVVQQTLGFAEEEPNISMGYPVFRTPLYSLLQILGELTETKDGDNYYVPSYLNFVLHPYVKNVLLNRHNEPTRVIFHTIEKHYTELSVRFLTLDEIEKDKKLLTKCFDNLPRLYKGQINPEMIEKHLNKIHSTLIKAFETIKDVEDFSDKLLNFVSFISRYSTANKHSYTEPFIKTMINVLYELKTSGLRYETFKETGSYFRLLRNYVRTIRYPFAGTPVKGLQVLGFLETRNIKFGTIYFIDTNEGIIPRAKKEETLLPYKVRKHLGLPTHEEREKISKYYFETLLGGAQDIHIFYVESEDKEKSRFVERLIWESQKKTKTLDTATADVFFNVRFSQVDTNRIKKTDAVMRFIKEKLTFSATGLDTYLKCPVQFFYDRILRLSEKREIADELDPRSRGSFVHDVLEDFFVEKIGEPLDIKDEDYKNIDKMVEEKFEKEYPHSDNGPIYLMKCQIKRRMNDVLNHHRNKYKNIIIRECENRKNPKDVKRDYPQYFMSLPLKSGRAITVSGVIDRVEERGNDIYILDYKTAKDADVPTSDFDITRREEWYTTLGSIQLPLYAFLYLENHKDVSARDVNCTLMLLGRKKIVEPVLFAEELQPVEKEMLFEQYKKAIIMLIEEIFDPKVDFIPASDPEEDCKWCSFKVLCGRQWVRKKW